MRAIRTAVAAVAAMLLAGCGTASHGAAGSTVGWFSGSSPTLTIVVSPDESSPSSAPLASTTTRTTVVTDAHRAATLTVPVRTVPLGGRLHIRGRCPHPGATASAYVTDAAGPALQQAFPVSRDGRFDTLIDLSRKVNAPRPAGKPALQPGAGSIGIGCTAGSETSVGQAVPITITGPTPTAPPAMKATIRVAPTRVARGDSVVVIGTCPKDTWFVSIDASDPSGVFTSTGTQVGPALTFNTSLAMTVGPNKAADHPATIIGSAVTVKATCNRLPNGGGDILFSATASVQLG